MTLYGEMLDWPLLTTRILSYAARHHGAQEVVSRTVEGPIHRSCYSETAQRSRRLAAALQRLGVQPGDRVATMAWNTHRHLETYYAVAGIGAVCHTLNPRLFKDQIIYILDHAADRMLFIDTTFLPALESLDPPPAALEKVIVLTDRAHMPAGSAYLCYEELIEAEGDRFAWPELDERQAAFLCYTSGTTGEPKGALYDHRAIVLHALCFQQGLDLSWAGSHDCLLMVVPMFHVCAWGLPFTTPLVGAKMVLPGPSYEPAALAALIRDEAVTHSAGVPTIWLGLLKHLEESGESLASLRLVACGGAAPPLAMIEAFEKTHGIGFVHGWGMTETGPLGSASILNRAERDAPLENRLQLKTKQGRPPFGVELKLLDDDSREVPQDGKTPGELYIRGAYVVGAYHNNPEATAESLRDGWFRTGDIGILDPDGRLQLTDRAKDLIKSGGEWISSIDLENAAMSHPAVAEAAAIARPHPKWEERPLLVVVPQAGSSPNKEDLLQHLSARVAKWWLPDDIVFVEELPHGATGKVSKRQLRARFEDYRWPD